jgi:hypothetical protein
MRGVWVAVVAVMILLPGWGVAQSPPTTLPPLVDAPGLPGGTDVSRPLTPVDPVPVAEPPAPPPFVPVDPEPVERIEEVQQQKHWRRGPLGDRWDAMTLLIWWPKAAPLPPLVTGTRSGAPPVLGAPGTVVLAGGQALDNQDIAGGRFVLGWSVNTAQTVGLEAVYFFLGTRTDSRIISEHSNPRLRALGLPYVNAFTGREEVFPLSMPGVAAGSVFLTTTTRAQGVEANVVANLYDGKHVRLNGIVGYRYLQVNEGVTVEQMRGTAAGFGPIYDQFDGHNRFHGGQLGFTADITRGVVFCELTGKVALGRTLEVVKIDGLTHVYTPVLGGLALATYPGGLYALPSNMGRYTSSVFGVVPEGIVKLGLKLGESGRVYVGYNFLYLSGAVRPGDQIDRTLNPVQVPALDLAGIPIVPDRPQMSFARSEWWAQGLIIGLETRY